MRITSSQLIQTMFINDLEHFLINTPSNQISGVIRHDEFSGGRHLELNELGGSQARIDMYDMGDISQFDIW